MTNWQEWAEKELQKEKLKAERSLMSQKRKAEYEAEIKKLELQTRLEEKKALIQERQLDLKLSELDDDDDDGREEETDPMNVLMMALAGKFINNNAGMNSWNPQETVILPPQQPPAVDITAEDAKIIVQNLKDQYGKNFKLVKTIPDEQLKKMIKAHFPAITENGLLLLLKEAKS